MIVKVTYDDQRLDIFDTSTFTASYPFGKDNMLTNFEVRFDTLHEDNSGLWIAAHSYQADRASTKESDETPVARRKRGWRFLIADAQELGHVELVVVDGEAIMKRVFGELIDLQAFDEAAYECIGSSAKGLRERAAELHRYLCKANGTESTEVPGIPASVMKKIMACSAVAAEDAEEDWGDVDEAGW